MILQLIILMRKMDIIETEKSFQVEVVDQQLLPLEVWKEISLYFPYNFFALNKYLAEIYNESWFQSKILLQYPNCKKHDNDWSFLYKRLLKFGNIYSIESRTPSLIKGIKITASNEKMINYDMILTFDGDLFYHNGIAEETKLIDTNVKDIANGAYIKGNEFYSLFYNIEPQLIVRSESPFLAIADNKDIFIGAITDNTFYYYSLHEEVYSDYECKNCVDLVHSGAFLIQKDNGTVMRYNDNEDILEMISIPPIKYLYPGSARLLDDKLITVYFDYDQNIHDMVLLTNVIPINDNNLRGSAICFRYHYLLIDDKLYDLDLKSNKIKLINSNVKNICDLFMIE